MDLRTELDAIKAEADAKLELLHDELNCKSETIEAISTELSDAREECARKAKELEDLRAKAAASEQKTCKDADIQRREIQRLTEENSVQANNVLQLEKSLITLRNELTEGNMKKIEHLRLQLSRSHAQEIDLLKTRHESHVRDAVELTKEQDKVAKDNALTSQKMEYEGKLKEQLDGSRRDAELLKAKLTEEIVSLRKESDGLKLVADEVPPLKQNVEKLEEDITSKQQNIVDLEEKNKRLNDIVQRTCQALKDLSQKAETLEVEIKAKDEQAISLELELAILKGNNSEELECIGLQIDEKDSAIAILKESQLRSESTVVRLNKQLEEARSEIVELGKFKEQTAQSALAFIDLSADMALCVDDVKEMNQLFSSTLEEIAVLMQRKDLHQSRKLSQCEESIAVLRNEVSMLLSEIDVGERANEELVEKIKCMEDAANDATKAMSEEKQSWEKSMEVMKAAMLHERLSWNKTREEMIAGYQKERATMNIRAQDEQDILNNQIVILRENMSKQQERSEYQRQILQAEFARKIESLNATISKIKFDDAIEMQEMESEKSTLVKRLEEKEHECTSMIKKIENIKEENLVKVDSLIRSHQVEMNAASETHRCELEGHIHEHEEKVKQLENELGNLTQAFQRLDEEKKSYTVHVQNQMTEGRRVILETVAGVREDLAGLRAFSSGEMSMSKLYLSRLVLDLKKQYNSRLKEYSDKITHLDQSHHEAMASLKEKSHNRVALAQKDLRDTKQVLFSTVQEGEEKLERTVRRLKEEHKAQLEAVAKKKTADFLDAVSKIKSLTKQCETLTQKHATKTNEVTKYDEKVVHLEKEIAGLKITQTKERRKLLRDAHGKETKLTDQFAKERSELKQKLLDAKEETQKIHEKYKAKGDVQQQIRALQKQMQMLEISERDAKDKLLRLQRQMEADKKKDSTVLRTIQSTRSPSGKDDVTSKFRSSSTGTGTIMKSRRGTEQSSVLPRVYRRPNPGRSSISKSLR